MDTGRIKPGSLVITIAIIVMVEISMLDVPLKPLIKTGVARCLEIFFVLMTFGFSGNGLGAIGFSRDRILPGFEKGLRWSAGFGILAAVIGMIIFLTGQNPLTLLHVRLPEALADRIMFFVIGGLVAPLAEEIFFRGVIYGFLRDQLRSVIRQWSVPAALIISTGLFVSAHQGGSGIPLPQLVGGVVFCAAYEIEKSLVTPFMIHSLGNLALFTFVAVLAESGGFFLTV